MANGLLAEPGFGARTSTRNDPESQRVAAALRAYWKQTMRRRPPAEREAWLKQAEVQAAIGATVCRQRLESITAEKDRIAQMMCSGGWVVAWESTGCPMPIECDDAGRAIPLVEWPVASAKRTGEFHARGKVQIVPAVGVCNGVTNVRLDGDGKPRLKPNGEPREASGGRVRVGRDRRELLETVLVPAYCVLSVRSSSRVSDRTQVSVRRAGEPVRGRRPDPMRLSRYGVRQGCEMPTGEPVESVPMAGRALRRWTPAMAVVTEDLIDGQGVMEAAFYPHPGSPSAEAIIRIGEMGATPLDGNW